MDTKGDWEFVKLPESTKEKSLKSCYDIVNPEQLEIDQKQDPVQESNKAFISQCNTFCVNDEKSHNHFHGGDSVIDKFERRCMISLQCTKSGNSFKTC